jgi:ubiquinone/menaquinone biosynthesis C-methylase UbiE
MTKEKHRVGRQKQPKDQTEPLVSGLSFRRPPATLNPIIRLFESPQKRIGPYIKNREVVADLGSGSGYYTLALAESVGPEGKVYAVDLDKERIRALEDKADKVGYHNIEAYASSASDLSYIKDRSVDFVLANGLL